jgi:hypothetical protein
MAVPSSLPTNILPATSGGSPQFYIDWTNGVDSAGQSGAIGAPWKTLTYAVNTRMKTGGTNDRKGLGAFINLRTNHYHSTAADTVPASLSLGGSVAQTQDSGGSVTDPWTIRTAPEDATDPVQGSGLQAKISARMVANTGLWNVRWERIDFDSAREDTSFFDTFQIVAPYNQLFYCELHGNRNALDLSGDYRSPEQFPDNSGAWGCLIHDGGTDTTGSPHDHGIYAGSGSPPGASDCWAVCCVIYRMTGFGVQFYEKATRFLLAHCTIDETSYPAGVTVKGGVMVAGDGSANWSRDCLIVNTIISTIPAGANDYAIILDSSGAPSSNKNAAHHNGYFVDATNEDTAAGDGYPNGIDYLGSNVDADPLYLSSAGRNYRLQPNSPMIGAGDGAYRPATDFDGKPYVTTDIGAFASSQQVLLPSFSRMRFSG